MINSIKLCIEQHKWQIKGDRVKQFTSGLNVLVGQNGSGKSRLLKAISECPECQRDESSQTNYCLFNTETMNPHTSDNFVDGNTGAVLKTRGIFSSHGEIMRASLSTFVFNPGDCLLIDEPESGQDIQWIVKIRKGLDTLCKKGCQVIIASHHPVFWKSTNVIELNKGYVGNALKIYRSTVETFLSTI